MATLQCHITERNHQAYCMLRQPTPSIALKFQRGVALPKEMLRSPFSTPRKSTQEVPIQGDASGLSLELNITEPALFAPTLSDKPAVLRGECRLTAKEAVTVKRLTVNLRGTSHIVWPHGENNIWFLETRNFPPELAICLNYNCFNRYSRTPYGDRQYIDTAWSRGDRPGASVLP